MKFYMFTAINFDLFTNSVNECDSYYYTGGAYDTESTTISHKEITHKKDKKTGDIIDDEKTVIDECFVYHIQFAIGEQYFSFRSFSEFFAWFDVLIDKIKNDSVSRETSPKFIIWVANFSHEWAFMKNYVKQRYTVTKCFAKNRRDVLLIELNGCVQFRESIGLWGHSLADISKNWCTKYKKLVGDLNYNKIRTFNTPIRSAKEKAYMKNDVLILTEMHNAIFKAYMRKNGVIYIPYTKSGLVRLRLKESIENDESLTAVRENIGGKWLNKGNVALLKNRNYHIFTTADDWNIIRQYGFSGGVVGSNINEVGKTLYNIKCADITSDYPYQMLSQKFPHGKILKGNSRDFEDCLKKHLPCFALLYIGEMRSTTQHAVFSHHKIINLKDKTFEERHGKPKDMIINNGKILTAKNCIVIMNDVDYDIYSKAYELKGVVCLTCWFFPWGYKKLPQWLTKCVIEDYITKSKLKEEGLKDTIEYKDSKSRVNTYFGTLATRPDDIFDMLDEKALFTPKHEFTFDELRRNTWLSPYWAFYITSYARKMLIEKIIKYPDSVVQYDTDSLYYKCNKQGKELEKDLQAFNAECIQANKRRFKDIPDNHFIETLGTWDFDEPYSRFLCLGAKKYIKEENDKIITVIAGLPKNAIPKEIHRYHVKKIFDRYNPIALESDVIIKHLFTNKFASAYDDTTTERYEPIKDYLGETVLQPVSSYHALVPIDFTLKIAPSYFSLIRQFQDVKKLQ